jgi:hypothetical protein
MIRILLSLSCLWWSLPLAAQASQSSDVVRVCAVERAVALPTVPPDFTGCQTQSRRDLNPQGQLLWVEWLWYNTQVMDPPLALFISGKQSSRVYLNGVLVGQNGEPAVGKEAETAGLMDAVLPLPDELIQVGENRFHILLSAHHGWLTLSQPIHRLYVGPHHRPGNEILRHYWPSLLPFGVLVLGLFYVLISIRLNQLPAHVWWLPLMALLAATQLFVEVSRGIVPYAYPWHDLRLLLILFCSLGFGLCLLAFVLRHSRPVPGSLKAGWLLLLALMLWWVPGFDSKTFLALLVPVATALVRLLPDAWRGRQPQRLMSVLLSAFGLVMLLSVLSFMDTVYYYAVALLIFLLLGQQARSTRDQQLATLERARQLEQIIEQRQLAEHTGRITLRSAGKTEWLMIRDLAYGQAAGDYVELFDVHGTSKLYHGTLSELVEELPAAFVKTHRSYLVNSALITALQRIPTGVGEVVLSTGARVPVSKRILPHIREQLS